jgi:hypothetical protein
MLQLKRQCGAVLKLTKLENVVSQILASLRTI